MHACMYTACIYIHALRETGTCPILWRTIDHLIIIIGKVKVHFGLEIVIHILLFLIKISKEN